MKERRCPTTAEPASIAGTSLDSWQLNQTHGEDSAAVLKYRMDLRVISKVAGSRGERVDDGLKRNTQTPMFRCHAKP